MKSVIVVLFLFLVACGSSTDNTPGDTEPSNEEVMNSDEVVNDAPSQEETESSTEEIISEGGDIDTSGAEEALNEW